VFVFASCGMFHHSNLGPPPSFVNGPASWADPFGLNKSSKQSDFSYQSIPSFFLQVLLVYTVFYPVDIFYYLPIIRVACFYFVKKSFFDCFWLDIFIAEIH
jgi:hypothetical protein